MEKGKKERTGRLTDSIYRIGEDGTIPPLGRDLLRALGTATGGWIHFVIDEEGQVSVKGIPPEKTTNITDGDIQGERLFNSIPQDAEQMSLFDQSAHESHHHRNE